MDLVVHMYHVLMILPTVQTLNSNYGVEREGERGNCMCQLTAYVGSIKCKVQSVNFLD